MTMPYFVLQTDCTINLLNKMSKDFKSFRVIAVLQNNFNMHDDIKFMRMVILAWVDDRDWLSIPERILFPKEKND